jgi:putative thiamine transport system permease protein
VKPSVPAAAVAAAIGLLWGLPLIFGLMFALLAVFDLSAWQAVFAHPQLAPAIALSLFTGSAALALSLGISLTIVAGLYRTHSWGRLAQVNGAFLAVPHLAFAIGLGFLIMPSGFIARFIAQVLTGWSEPPGWTTTQDPLGLSLIAALVLKETPFLIWSMWALLARGDMALMLEGQYRTARSLGHAPASIWVKLFVPQILRRIVWPIIVVWVYGATVVDMALVIGPTQPPVYALIAWTDLNDAEAPVNARGAAGAVLLAGILAIVAGIARAVIGLAGRWITALVTKGPPASPSSNALPTARVLLAAMGIVYAFVVLVLAIFSMAPQWPFPALLPAILQLRSWSVILTSPAPLIESLILAILTSSSALLLCVAWFEATPRRHDTMLGLTVLASLAIPQITLVGGQYSFFLSLGLNGTQTGLFLAHLTPVLAYVFIVLMGPYRAFDRRFKSVSLGLNCSAWRFWYEVKRPLMLPSLAAAAAAGFAVSMAQFLPAQLIGSGRLTTLPVEAVTLASGGNRSLLAVFALALTIPAALAFFAAQQLGRPAWSKA